METSVYVIKQYEKDTNPTIQNWHRTPECHRLANRNHERPVIEVELTEARAMPGHRYDPGEFVYLQPCKYCDAPA